MCFAASGSFDSCGVIHDVVVGGPFELCAVPNRLNLRLQGPHFLHNNLENLFYISPYPRCPESLADVEYPLLVQSAEDDVAHLLEGEVVPGIG